MKQDKFLLVHGAWHGGWCWERVVALLTDAGHDALAPTLLGVGERFHEGPSSTGLRTHIDELSSLFETADLCAVILCGHSYGGTLIRGLGQVFQKRINALGYLDAVVADEG